MKTNINKPWQTLDNWQKDYLETPAEQNCFLLCGRQVGKTTAMSIKAVELCLKHYRQGDRILIASITEKQGYHLLAKCLGYAEERYSREIKRGKDRPTMHRIKFKNGTEILSFAAGESGEGLRGYTIKKLLIDEGSRMSDEFFTAITPAMSVAGGSMDIASTPCGKGGFFYEASKDESFKKFYVSAEDCPRHSEEFLKKEKERMSQLQYAQEYLAQFLDKLKRVFSDEWIHKVCTLKRQQIAPKSAKYFLGMDIAGLGGDETTLEVLAAKNNGQIEQVENAILKGEITTKVSGEVINIEERFKFSQIGIDDGGVGFGVWSELMSNETTKRKTKALNNASRSIDRHGNKKKKLLKEEMYYNLLALGEHDKIKLLQDDELIASLKSVQHEDNKIFGNYTHIVEGIIRAAWIASQEKSLNIYVYF